MNMTERQALDVINGTAPAGAPEVTSFDVAQAAFNGVPVDSKNEWLTALYNKIVSTQVHKQLMVRNPLMQEFMMAKLPVGLMIETVSIRPVTAKDYDKAKLIPDFSESDVVRNCVFNQEKKLFELFLNYDILKAAFVSLGNFNSFIQGQIDSLMEGIELYWLEYFTKWLPDNVINTRDYKSSGEMNIIDVIKHIWYDIVDELESGYGSYEWNIGHTSTATKESTYKTETIDSKYPAGSINPDDKPMLQLKYASDLVLIMSMKDYKTLSTGGDFSLADMEVVNRVLSKFKKVIPAQIPSGTAIVCESDAFKCYWRIEQAGGQYFPRNMSQYIVQHRWLNIIFNPIACGRKYTYTMNNTIPVTNYGVTVKGTIETKAAPAAKESKEKDTEE